MKKAPSDSEQQVRALKRMKDSEIDTTDIPELSNWSEAVVGKFYRPIKKSVTIRLDADVVAWLKSEGDGYQTRINRILRAAMHGRGRRRRQAPDEDAY